MTQHFKGDPIEETMVSSSSGLADRLLHQLATLEPDGELEDAIWALVSVFAEGHDDLCIGVCVPDVKGEQLVVRHAPRPSQPRITDAARLFPEANHESITSIPFDEGSTLHVGTDELPDSAMRRALDQLSMAIGSTVRRARKVAALKAESEAATAFRDQAVQSDKLAGLGRMAASIVHELNNPLTSIVTYADYLKRRFDREGVDPQDRERIGRISDAANRVLSFTRDLVAYSRPTNATPSALSIHDVIERALIFCDHVVSANDITVVRRYGELPSIRGLHGPLTQVFVNLVTNAVQAMEAGGRIAIETWPSDDTKEVFIRVVDSGHGIDPSQLERIFEPYFTTRSERGGSGLGLDIVRTIVAGHGGTVTATNGTAGDDPGGAAFTVALPTTAR
jgi:signal transduction histidine kinase